ncbi:MAG TPA: PRC-barrel domain-containing protein [Acetobacteraceae bacterium]|nr:PRC-barrel domain-containing protein [Acetobacteraceae bacterium]
MRKHVLTSALVLVLGAAPVLAVAAVPGENTGPSPIRTEAAKLTPWISVTSAQDIAGRMLRDPQGREAGRIRSIVVDLERGDAAYALVGSAGALDIGESHAAVPFSALHLSRDEDVMNVALSVDRIAAGPRFDPARLDELGEPGRVGQIYEHYAIAMPSGYVLPPSGERAVHPDRFVLVRPGEILRLGPAWTVAQDVRGEVVKAANGDTIGEIDRIMIDPSTGRIAYLLLSRGGFLGIGEEWVPVPAQAVAWSSQADAFTLKSGAAQPERITQLQHDEVPTQVQRDQLQALYERYGVTPYWQEG